MVFRLYKGRDPKSNRIFAVFFMVPYVALMLWAIIDGYNGSLNAAFKDGPAIVLFALTYPIALIIWVFTDQKYSQGKFVVAEEGITFSTKAIKHFMPWNNLSHIVIKKNIIHFYSNLTVQRFGENITTYPLNYTPKIYAGNDGKLVMEKVALGIVSPKNTSEHYMYVKYNGELLKEVKKYFKKDITNEYSLYMKGVGKWH